jgi:RNA polymerase sigma-70 factor, ECF subfamily
MCINNRMAPGEFQRIHDSFRPRVLRYLTRLVGERDAEDLTQTVMLKVSSGLPGFRHDSSISTWIYRIATNVATDKLRRPVREQALDGEPGPEGSEDALDAGTPSVEESVIRTEMSACIREFIDQLPDSYKMVVVLSEVEGFKNAEIAAILGVSLDTVKIRLHRAREQLRADLKAGCSFYRDESAELACDRKTA